MNFFCPIYRQATDSRPWRNAQTAHAGLLFDKFANAWDWKRDKRSKEPLSPRTPVFDGGDQIKEDRDKQDHGKEGAWIRSWSGHRAGDSALLEEACLRQYELVESLGGVVRRFTNASRFITGLGRTHPLENGFAFHPTLGVPYLAGSGIKGVLRTWLRETHGTWDPQAKEGEGDWKESDGTKAIFGSQDRIGRAVFLDLLPTRPPQLVTEVMTPHYSPYYQHQETPGDWHSPVPIPFLAVEAGQEWQVAILPAKTALDEDGPDLERLAGELAEALDWLGAGAKTAVGYGRFVSDKDAEQRLRQEHERRRVEEEQARQRADEERAFEASLADDSPPLQRLKRLRREQGWALNPGDQNMIRALNELADEHPQPPADCIAWARELLESIPKYAGVWSDPDAMRGKRKDQPKYKAPSVRALVRRLNPDLL